MVKWIAVKWIAAVGLALSVASPAFASPAFAAEVSESVQLPVSAKRVWQQIEPFCGIGDWHPAVQSCTLQKRDGHLERAIALKGGGEIVEKRLSTSGKKHRMTYAIVSSPLPVKDYKSVMTVTPSGHGSKLTWKGTFTPNGASEDEAKKVIAGIYTSGFDGLKAKLGAK